MVVDVMNMIVVVLKKRKDKRRETVNVPLDEGRGDVGIPCSVSTMRAGSL